MFVLAELQDTVRIPPDQFHKELTDAICDDINRKLANKVLLKVGLCIALKDIVAIKDSILIPCDGASHTTVSFRYIVFRPVIGTIVTGKIRSCSHEGVCVTMGFFDDIFVPADALQHPSRFDENERAWVWEYPLEDGSKHDLFMDVGEAIKFRVVREIFEECSPVTVGTEGLNDTLGETKAPYKLIGAINESGLGVSSWWDQHSKEGFENYENYESDENGDGAYEE